MFPITVLALNMESTESAVLERLTKNMSDLLICRREGIVRCNASGVQSKRLTRTAIEPHNGGKAKHAIDPFTPLPLGCKLAFNISNACYPETGELKKQETKNRKRREPCRGQPFHCTHLKKRLGNHQP